MLGADEPPGVERTTFTVALVERGGRQSVVGAACDEDVAFALFRAVAAAHPGQTVTLWSADRRRELAVSP